VVRRKDLNGGNARWVAMIIQRPAFAPESGEGWLNWDAELVDGSGDFRKGALQRVGLLVLPSKPSARETRWVRRPTRPSHCKSLCKMRPNGDELNQRFVLEPRWETARVYAFVWEGCVTSRKENSVLSQYYIFNQMQHQRGPTTSSVECRSVS
jgi:hypothetical protein